MSDKNEKDKKKAEIEAKNAAEKEQENGTDTSGSKKKYKKKAGDEAMQNVSRADFMFEDFITDTFKRTAEGFLTGRAVITNVGVFPYINKDGDVVRELRLPEEVFHPDSMKTLSMSPLTLGHPNELVTAENAKRLSVGFVGDGLYTDAYHISAPITVTDADAVDAAKNKGTKALSAGYTVDLEAKSGVWMGVKYDAIQRNIRYNHVAIVDRGRAGDDAVMKFDSIDAISVNDKIDPNTKKDTKSTKEAHNMSTKKVNIDGLDYEVEADVAKHIVSIQKKADTLSSDLEALKTDKATIEGERDSLKEQNDQLKKDMDELKKSEPAKLDEAVQSRIDLIHKVEKCGVEVTDGMNPVEMKKAVIMKAFPNADSAKLDEAEVAYVDARFDSAVEILSEKQDKADKNDKEVNGDVPGSKKEDKQEVNADAAREKMIENMKSASQAGK